VYEVVYVTKNHTWGHGWNHTLSFLHAIPGERRGAKEAYVPYSQEQSHVLREEGHGEFRQPSGEEAPPVYTGPSVGFSNPPAPWSASHRPGLSSMEEGLPVYPGR
jgi:hypothetical protein